MENKDILETVEQYIKDHYENETSGHDYYHIQRVHKMAMKINEKEKADEFVIGMTAYLHDVFDDKFYQGNNKEQDYIKLFKNLNINEEIKHEDKNNIIHSCINLSFSKRAEKIELSKEGKIVQDADRIDALGAIAIARTFQYTGKIGRSMYNPQDPKEAVTPEEYAKNGSKTAFAHFYDKILKIKEMLNIQTAKQIAEKRHQFVEKYMEEFLAEWDGLK